MNQTRPLHSSLLWRCACVGLALLIVLPQDACAKEASAARQTEHVGLTLLSDVHTVAKGRWFHVGVRMQIEKHWHVYWKEPGDAGLAPTFEWMLPEGFEIEAPLWPLPSWHKVEDNWTMIYEKEVFFTFRVKAPKSLSKAATLSVRVDWLVCHDADGCKPGDATLSILLPISGSDPAPTQHKSTFEKHQQRAPKPMPPTWTLSDDRQSLLVAGKGPWADPEAAFDFFPESFDTFDRSLRTTHERSDAGITLKLPAMRVDGNAPHAFHGVLEVRKGPSRTGYSVGWGERALEPLSTVLTNETGVANETVASTETSTGRPGHAPPEAHASLEAHAPPEASSAAPLHDDLTWAHAYVEYGGATSGDDAETSWAWVVLLALAGGLILNLMPCVLPVLSLKVLGLVEHAGESPLRMRRHGYAFSLGVIVSFLAVAGLLLGLRNAGAEIGWGFQMQEPAVVVALCFLMFLLGLNMFGVFEIGAGLTRFGGTSTHSGYTSSFATGVLTTVVATPCTAPFMGTAIGYAMTQPSAVALSVFGALGIGMSAPYALITAFPSLLKWIPKPGPWMETLRHVLAFPIMATVVWLAWVFGRQMGGDSVPFLLAGLLLAAAAAWCYGRFGAMHRSSKTRWLVGRTLALMLLVVGVGLALMQEPAPSTPANNPEGWEAYNGHAIGQHQNAGRPVFLDFTADWCLTCKANDATTLRSEAVTRAFKKHNIAPMIADWTRRDDRITKALSKLDRSSVPVYVIVPPDPSREAVVLRTAITPRYLVEALANVLN